MCVQHEFLQYYKFFLNPIFKKLFQLNNAKKEKKNESGVYY